MEVVVDRSVQLTIVADLLSPRRSADATRPGRRDHRIPARSPRNRRCAQTVCKIGAAAHPPRRLDCFAGKRAVSVRILVQSAGASGRIGLFDAADFVISTGSDASSTALPQALWYFQDQTIALARDHARVAGFATGMSAVADVSAWFRATPAVARAEPPPLVWMGAPEIARAARLHRDPLELHNSHQRLALRFAPRLASNRSWIDNSTLSFLESRTLTARGDVVGDSFVARTLWPDDFRIDAALASSAGTSASMRDIRNLIHGAPGGRRSTFNAQLLWERMPGERAWRGKSILALILNGAQGDDDEAHGGHFAIVTGRMQDDGAIGDWMVNNFYTLDTTSEKGILAAPVPLDSYLADLNSGQAWYRPSWMLVAVLAEDRVAAMIQSALSRVYNHFYRHDLIYDHATMNCAGISVDTLRALGWPVAREGPTSRALAIAGLPWFALRTGSLAKAARNYDYLTEDRTRLFPAVAFDAIGADLLACAHAARSAEATPRTRPNASLLARLAQDIDALAFLRIPQFPSSRAWGAAPAATAWEYEARLPKDPAKVQIVPVSPRPFPSRLLADDICPPPLSRGTRALMAWGAVLTVGAVWLASAWRRHVRKAGTL